MYFFDFRLLFLVFSIIYSFANLNNMLIRLPQKIAKINLYPK